MQELKALTLSDLERMTGITFKTLTKKLQDLEPVETTNKEIYYKTREALPLLYHHHNQQSSASDLTRERARLAQKQADKLELEIAAMQEKLVDVEEWHDLYAKKITSFKDTLRNMALRIAGEVSKCDDVDENYELISSYVDEALTELAGTKT